MRASIDYICHIDVFWKLSLGRPVLFLFVSLFLFMSLVFAMMIINIYL